MKDAFIKNKELFKIMKRIKHSIDNYPSSKNITPLQYKRMVRLYESFLKRYDND